MMIWWFSPQCESWRFRQCSKCCEIGITPIFKRTKRMRSWKDNKSSRLELLLQGLDKIWRGISQYKIFSLGKFEKKWFLDFDMDIEQTIKYKKSIDDYHRTSPNLRSMPIANRRIVMKTIFNRWHGDDTYLIFWGLVINVKKSRHKLTPPVAHRTVVNLVHKCQLERIDYNWKLVFNMHLQYPHPPKTSMQKGYLKMKKKEIDAVQTQIYSSIQSSE